MRYVLLLIFLNSIDKTFSQNSKDFHDRKQGRWEFTEERDEILGFKPIVECNYLNDTLQGLLKKYDENKILRFEVKMVKGQKQGSAQVFNETGRLICIYDYIDDTMRKRIRIEKKRVIDITEYKSGKVEGFYISFFKNGRMSKKDTYVKGMMDGESIHYYRNGKIKTIRKCKENQYKSFKYYSKRGKLIKNETYSEVPK
jgi:antitoxin component YwqK of YwqJK toxin-antitoxin module